MYGRGRHFGGGPRHRGDSRHTLLEARMIEPALLAMLSTQNLHGYTLLEKLGELGLSTMHPSMVYRTLRVMEDAGWVSSMWERELTQGPPRRVYVLTQDGRDTLALWKTYLLRTQSIVARLLEMLQVEETSTDPNAVKGV
jgi:PadR family transcriptional regulator PadR